MKLGTMGEYGTPNIDIEEGYITIEHNGRKDVLPFPKQPGSFYHLSKVHDSHNIMFACKIWGLRATDLNQGVVYGTLTDETALDEALINRFDYDDVFGTVLNRFCVQAAIGHPLTVYGKGGQTRGFLDIRDTVRCIEIACLQSGGAWRMPGVQPVHRAILHPATGATGADSGAENGAAGGNRSSARPARGSRRALLQRQTFQADRSGIDAALLSDSLLDSLMNIAMKYRDRVDPSLFMPQVNWRNATNDRHAQPPAQAAAASAAATSHSGAAVLTEKPAARRSVGNSGFEAAIGLKRRKRSNQLRCGRFSFQVFR